MSEVKTTFVGDASHLNKTLGEVEQRTGKTGSIMHGIFTGVGIGAVDLATEGIGKVIDFLGESSKEAREAEVVNTRLTQALQNNVKGFKGDASAMEESINAGRKLGFVDDEVTAALARLVGVTKNKEQATTDAAIAEDLARAKGIDLATATGIVIKAQLGSVGALKKLGIEVPAVTTAMDALKASHDKATPAQIAAAKAADKHATATAALEAIHKSAKGQAEAYAGTMDGSVAVATATVRDIQEKLGTSLNNMVASVLPPLVAGLGTVGDMFGQLVSAAQPFVDQVVALAGRWMAALGEAFGQISEAIKPLLPVIAQLVQDDLAALGTIIKNVAQWVTTTLVPAFTTVVKNVLPPLTAALTWVANDVLPSVADAIGFVAAHALPPLRSALDWVAKNVLPKLADAFDWIVTNVLPPLTKAFKWVADNVLPALGTGFAVVTDKVLPAVSGAFQDAGAVVGTVIDILGKVIKKVSDVISFLAGAGGKITHAVSGMWDGLWTGFKGVINSIIGGWNGLKFSMPSIDLGPLGHVGGFTIGTPNIPYLHSGGVVPGVPGSDVLAMLQAGERVLPRGATGGGAPIVVNINGGLIDGPTIDALTNALARRLQFAPGT